MTREGLDKGKQHVKDMVQKREQNDEANDTGLLTVWLMRRLCKSRQNEYR
jgi:hypothetical protein